MITVGAILIVPSLYYKMIKEEYDTRQVNKSFFRYLGSKSFWAFFAIFMFGIPCFHAALDLLFEGFSYIFSFHHVMFKDDPFCKWLVGFYWVLAFCILLIVPSVYFSPFSKNSESKK